MGLNTTPAPWTIDEVVSASKMTTEVHDAFTGLQAAWDAFTPTWTNTTTNPAIGNGTLAGKWWRSGKTVHFEIHLVFGTTTTSGTGARWEFTLPATPNNASYDVIGRGTLRDVSAANNYGRTCMLIGGVVQLITEAGVAVQDGVPFTWASTDRLNIAGTYEST